MPYIDQLSRARLEVIDVREPIDSNPKTPGDLNYLITSLIDEYTKGQLSYSTINEVMGVLECVKQEYYRRVAVPYEEEKRSLNGDVFHSTS